MYAGRPDRYFDSGDKNVTSTVRDHQITRDVSNMIISTGFEIQPPVFLIIENGTQSS
jgi:hypothetical protein